MGSNWLGDQELGMGNTVFVMRSLEGPKKGRQKGDTVKKGYLQGGRDVKRL